jgi:hypothetical protein
MGLLEGSIGGSDWVCDVDVVKFILRWLIYYPRLYLDQPVTCVETLQCHNHAFLYQVFIYVFKICF